MVYTKYAGLIANLPAVRPRKIFHRLCTVTLDLQISQSVEDSSTVPSSYLLTIISLPSSLFH